MKIKSLTLLFLATLILSCSENNDVVVEPVSVTFNFSHSWNGTDVTSSDFNDVKFVNENEDTLSIVRLRYLVSDIIFTHESGVETSAGIYNLVDLTNSENLSFTTPTDILPGDYTVSFRFGFKDEDNLDGVYADLNTANFNVPAMLNGGYHYMQFDGNYRDTSGGDSPFNFHAIRAFDTSGANDPVDTSVEVSLGSITVQSSTQINVQMDIYNWFSNPNLWDINTLNVLLMPNYDAQLMISQNGANVFSLVDVTQ